MEIKELKEKYSEHCRQEGMLRKEIIKVICNKVSSILAGTKSKKLDYGQWAGEACDVDCMPSVIFKYTHDSGPVVAIEPNGTESFSVDVSGEDTYTIEEYGLSTDQCMNLIDDLEALEQSLSGKANDGKIEWKINEDGVFAGYSQTLTLSVAPYAGLGYDVPCIGNTIVFYNSY